jgi:putative SOS response-associated peptidase YedK
MNDKVKYKFNLPDAEALYMAAIYKVFHVADGSQIRHFSILTAAANDSMRDVHSRMPVVLRRGEFDEWLYGDYARLWERRDVLLERKAVA